MFMGRRSSYYDFHRQSIFTQSSARGSVQTQIVDQNGWRARCRPKLYSSCYTGFTAALNILSLVALLTGQFLIDSNAKIKALNWWASGAVIVNAYFFIDLLLNVVVFGFNYIITNKKILLIESILQVMAITADCRYFFGNQQQKLDAINLFNVVSLFRILRLLYLLTELS